jgi:hypothetical protein
MSEMVTFVDACLRGEANLADVDDWVERWHGTGGAPDSEPIELSDYLGLADEEYAEWVTNSDAIRKSLARQRQRAWIRSYLPKRTEADHDGFRSWLASHGWALDSDGGIEVLAFTPDEPAARMVAEIARAGHTVLAVTVLEPRHLVAGLVTLGDVTGGAPEVQVNASTTVADVFIALMGGKPGDLAVQHPEDPTLQLEFELVPA